MRQFHKAGVALLAGLAGLALGGVAQADNAPGAPQADTQADTQKSAQHSPEGKPEAKKGAKPESKPKALGAGIGGQESGAATFVLGPLDTAEGCKGAGMSQGYGAGVGPGGEESPEGVEPGKPGASAPAPVPQYWLADASLFVANASNAAQTLANEQTLGVQAPSVLGNQAQFLLASTDRAISSLKALRASAEVTHPRALADIRGAMNELMAAKAQAKQALDAANEGTLGPGDEGALRSTYEHLQAAERDVQGAGRAIGAPGFTLASVCAFRGGRAMGAGIGGGKGAPATTPAPEKEKEKVTPAPEPAPGTEKP